MTRSKQWICCGLLMLPACGGTQSSSEQPERQPVDPPKRAQDIEIEHSAGVLGAMGDAGDLEWLKGGFSSGGIGNARDGLADGAAVQMQGAGGLGATGKGAGGDSSVSGASFGPASSARRRRPPTLVPGTPSVQGALDQDVVRVIVENQLPRLRLCYQQGLDPTLAGKVVTGFVIGPSGKVESVRDAGSTLPAPAVTACVQTAFQSMAFPAPKDGGAVVVVYPVVVAPAANTSRDAGAPEAAQPSVPSHP